MVEFNVADAAKKMSDGEISASIAAMRAEQERRAFVKQYGEGVTPRAVEIAHERHEKLYGGQHNGSLATF